MIPKVVSCHTRFIIGIIHPLVKKGNVREIKILLFTSGNFLWKASIKRCLKTIYMYVKILITYLFILKMFEVEKIHIILE